jgi:hypothetical protein
MKFSNRGQVHANKNKYDQKAGPLKLPATTLPARHFKKKAGKA